jgi:hypothetical protein
LLALPATYRIGNFDLQASDEILSLGKKFVRLGGCRLRFLRFPLRQQCQPSKELLTASSSAELASWKIEMSWIAFDSAALASPSSS